MAQVENGWRPPQPFLQRRYTNGQQGPETILNVISHHRNASQNHRRYYFPHAKMAIMRPVITKRMKGVKGGLCYPRKEITNENKQCEKSDGGQDEGPASVVMVKNRSPHALLIRTYDEPFWKTVWQFLKRLNMEFYQMTQQLHPQVPTERNEIVST